MYLILKIEYCISIFLILNLQIKLELNSSVWLWLTVICTSGKFMILTLHGCICVFSWIWCTLCILICWFHIKYFEFLYLMTSLVKIHWFKNVLTVWFWNEMENSDFWWGRDESWKVVKLEWVKRLMDTILWNFLSFSKIFLLNKMLFIKNTYIHSWSVQL